MRKTTSFQVATWLISVGVLPLCACNAVIEGGSNPRQPGATSPDQASTPSDIDPKTGVPSRCGDNQVLAAPAPLLRLTNQEYLNTLRDLFPGVALPSLNLPSDNKDDGFDTMAIAQSASAPLVEAYFNYAGDVAVAAVSKVADFVPCAAEATSADSCGQDFPKQFAEKAYRRPVTDSEHTRLAALFATAKQSFGLSKAIEVTIRGVLQSAAFLYRPEFGARDQVENGTTLLSPYEMASRLSYLFWDTLPHSGLLKAAESGELGTGEGVRAQAKRLLADPRAKAAVARYHSQWLRFEKLEGLKKSPTLFPNFSATTAGALRESTARYVDHLFWEKRSLGAWFTDDHAFVNDALAPLYGVASPGAELALVQVSSAQRAGILTQAGLLAGFAHETSGAPVLRGVFVLSRLLCSEPAPPPPNIPALTDPKPTDAPKTTRQHLEETHSGPACIGCHETIDGMGFGFEHYDAVGAYREQDNGLPVDATGVLKHTVDADGPFNGAVELGKKLGQSVQVQACVTKQWARYALGATLDDIDDCAIKQAIEQLQASGGDLQELLPALLASDAFRRRTVIE